MKYILNYFDAAGRAEPIRLMFHIAGIDFEDNRMSRDEWAKAKTDVKRFPIGQAPTLQVDDDVICQSGAISRYIATELGFYGESTTEQALIDQVTETINDIATTAIPILFSGHDDETKKTKFAEVFASETFKRKLAFISNVLKSNNGGVGFIVGNKLSMADLLLFCIDRFFLEPNGANYLDDFPELKKLNERVLAVDSIKRYYESKK